MYIIECNCHMKKLILIYNIRNIKSLYNLKICVYFGLFMEGTRVYSCAYIYNSQNIISYPVL